jgi:hypothetical protein
VSVVRWNPDEHLELVEGWMRERGQDFVPGKRSFYPPTGFLVDNAAVGFVYLTNASGVCYIDSCITDPRSPRARRRQAVATLLAALVTEGFEKGAELIAFFTEHASLIDIGKAHGFTAFGGSHACLALRR